MSLRALIAALALLCGAQFAAAAPSCGEIRHRGLDFTICRVDPGVDHLALFLKREDDTPFGHFSRIEEHLSSMGKSLLFAMNAGMYHTDRSPVGLYVENGKEAQRLITSAGPGNFGMLPNGVLCLRDGRADVFESRSFAADGPACQSATQSGPMLVIDGALHPRFIKDSTSRFVRNGVGTTQDGQVAIFAISNEPVNFHEFATLFRDVLGLPNALYFDGNISRLHAADIGRSDGGFLMGPIIGVVGQPGEGS